MINLHCILHFEGKKKGFIAVVIMYPQMFTITKRSRSAELATIGNRPDAFRLCNLYMLLPYLFLPNKAHFLDTDPRSIHTETHG